jgi:hypothetical protein
MPSFLAFIGVFMSKMRCGIGILFFWGNGTWVDGTNVAKNNFETWFFYIYYLFYSLEIL